MALGGGAAALPWRAASAATSADGDPRSLGAGSELRLSLDLMAPRAEPLLMSDGVSLALRAASGEGEDAYWDDILQNNLSYPLDGGGAMALEATFRFAATEPKRAALRIGVPLALLPRPLRKDHAVVLRVSEARVQLIVDGVLFDEEWPTDPVLSFENPQVASPRATDVRAGAAPRALPYDAGGPSALQYFTPPGHNTWAGDAMCFAHGGVFHVFYLLDRRHGSSKFGAGAHQFAHTSSRDLKTWTHHPLALTIDEPWLSYGTGKPVVHNGKIVLFYGMMTDRLRPVSQTAHPRLKAAVARDGVFEAEPFFANGEYPMGCSVALSDDAINFTKTDELIGLPQDPAPFIDKGSGKLYLLAGYGDDGLYESIDGLERWRLVDRNFLPTGQRSPQGNTLECQCKFEWNGWHYIVAGRTGMWMAKDALGPYWPGAKDAAGKTIYRPRWDIYDGLWVPKVAEWNGRYLSAGWLTGPDLPYAGYLVMRELVQMPDGTLGLKWPAEMIPEAGAPRPVRKNIVIRARGQGTAWSKSIPVPQNARITMRLAPRGDVANFGVRFGDAELKFDPGAKRAQWCTAEGDTPAQNLPTLEQLLAVEPYSPIWEPQTLNYHFIGGEFTIQQVEPITGAFTLDMIVKYDPKGRGSIIDAEIGGERTIITRRPRRQIDAMRLFATGGALAVASLSIRPLL